MVKSGLNSLKEEDGICSLLEVRESQDRIIEKDKKNMKIWSFIKGDFWSGGICNRCYIKQ